MSNQVFRNSTSKYSDPITSVLVTDLSGCWAVDLPMTLTLTKTNNIVYVSINASVDIADSTNVFWTLDDTVDVIFRPDTTIQVPIIALSGNPPVNHAVTFSITALGIITFRTTVDPVVGQNAGFVQKAQTSYII